VSVFSHNTYDNIRTRAIVTSEGHILLEPPPNEKQGWLCPGGGLEPHESLAECAKREVLEETGLNVTIAGVAFLREWVVPKYASPAIADSVAIIHGTHSGKDHGFGLEVFFYATPLSPLQPPRPEADSDNFRWVPLLQVPAMPVWPAELKWLCRRIARGEQPRQILSFVTDMESPWLDLPADPFADLES
jgi:8-oxo-dGTP pyrophosphatase MutT (NUDIX family)